MGCISIPYRRLPHQPKLFLRLLDDFSGVSNFYAHPPTLEAVQRAAATQEFPPGRRREVASILRDLNRGLGSGEETERNLQRFENGAAAVVSGQQVGLFGGPAYAFYKALSAIRVAEEVTQAGIQAVPVFWMATEDHDLDEVRHVSWFKSGALTRFELASHDSNLTPVGRVKLGPAIQELTKAAVEQLAGPEANSIGQILLESYRAEETYGTAFGKLFSRLFAQYGLILLDPLDVRLHRVAAPIYKRALEDRDVLNAKLLERGKELEASGVDPQVKVTASSTLVFHMTADAREPVVASDGEFRSGSKSWSRLEAVRLAEVEPETFSPNALLRPVIQDYLLPTVAFLGGSAEISYLAQSEVVYRHLLGGMPVILPRADFTILDAKADKLLERFELCIENVWAGRQELRRKIESIAVPTELASDFDRKKEEIESTLAKLGADIEKLDATLAGAVSNTQEKMSFQLDSLRRKVGRALDERAGLITAKVEFLENLLYPNKTLQSRELSLLPFLATWGAKGMKELHDLAGTSNLKEHRIVRMA
jgi:bacillithiol biosynthesis cysteine-adding enzyme BshC